MDYVICACLLAYFECLLAYFECLLAYLRTHSLTHSLTYLLLVLTFLLSIRQDSAELTVVILMARRNVADGTGANRVWALEQAAG